MDWHSISGKSSLPIGTFALSRVARVVLSVSQVLHPIDILFPLEEVEEASRPVVQYIATLSNIINQPSFPSRLNPPLHANLLPSSSQNSTSHTPNYPPKRAPHAEYHTFKLNSYQYLIPPPSQPCSSFSSSSLPEIISENGA